MYGQTTSKMTLSGRVKGFTDTPTLICDLSMEHVKPDTLLIRPDGTFSQEIVIPGVKNAFFKVHDGKDNPHSYLLYLAPDKSLHVDIQGIPVRKPIIRTYTAKRLPFPKNSVTIHGEIFLILTHV